MIVAGGLQFGNVVGQIDVQMLDDVRPVVVGHPELYNVVLAVIVHQRAAVAAAVLLQVLVRRPLVLRRPLSRQRAVSAVHVLLDFGRHERAQALGLGRRHEMYLARDRSAAAVLLHRVLGRAVQLMVQLLLVVQLLLKRTETVRLRLVRGRRLERRLEQVPLAAAAVAEMLVAQVTEMLVLVAVRSGVLVAVRRLARVPVLVRHLAAVLVVVFHFTGMHQRYLARKFVRVHMVHVMRRFFGHHDDDPVVSERKNKNLNQK